jgi:hypothetical protein
MSDSHSSPLVSAHEPKRVYNPAHESVDVLRELVDRFNKAPAYVQAYVTAEPALRLLAARARVAVQLSGVACAPGAEPRGWCSSCRAEHAGPVTL